MSEWKEYRFSDVLIDESISYGIVQPGFHKNNGVPIVRVNNIKNGIISTEDVLKVDADVESKYQRTRLTGGELLITVVGSVGECAIVPNLLKGWNVARAVSVARIKDEHSTSFIKYSFQSEDIKHQLYGNTNDTVQPTLNLSSLKEIIFKLPSLTAQKTIAEILSSLDDKIDLLHRQNKTLEQLAETLFRQWFVEEAEEDWERTTVGEKLVTVLGGTPSTTKSEFWDGDIAWINSGEVNRFRIDSPSRYITKLGLEKSNTKLLPKGTTVIAITGATLGQISLLEIDSCANQSVVGIIPNDILPKEFVFFWIKYKLPDIILNETGGAQPHVNKNDVNEAELILPPLMLLKEKNSLLADYFGKISNNTNQIKTLQQLRDTLLPKLMSGEVQVSI